MPCILLPVTICKRCWSLIREKKGQIRRRMSERAAWSGTRNASQQWVFGYQNGKNEKKGHVRNPRTSEDYTRQNMTHVSAPLTFFFSPAFSLGKIANKPAGSGRSRGRVFSRPPVSGLLTSVSSGVPRARRRRRTPRRTAKRPLRTAKSGGKRRRGEHRTRQDRMYATSSRCHRMANFGRWK